MQIVTFFKNTTFIFNQENRDTRTILRLKDIYKHMLTHNIHA